jgi:nucleotide-binding universal stress UspA family protein
MEKIKRVLVVNRTRQYAGEEVKVAQSVADKYGAEVVLLHLLMHPVDMEALNAPLPYKDEKPSRTTSIQDEAREDLGQILRKEVGVSAAVKILIKSGDADDEVLKVVQEEKIDLMVLMAHQQGRLEHMLFGKENDKLIRNMPCSILLVKKEPEPVDW